MCTLFYSNILVKLKTEYESLSLQTQNDHNLQTKL